MILSFTLGGTHYRFDSSTPIDISIPLDPYGAQPNAFHLPAASARAVEAGSFIGDTRRGGSCNCETVTFTPHGNGTHTEGVGHITNMRLAVSRLLSEALIPAVLVTVRLAGDEGMPGEDRAITRSALDAALAPLAAIPAEFHRALIIRSLPNEPTKLDAHYSGANPSYITPDAMRLIREWGTEHLLIDLPSADREDDGLLTAHRIFWDVAEHGNDDAGASGRTITEMIFVPDDMADGVYMLDLQIPSMLLDAVPSRPLLYRVSAA